MSTKPLLHYDVSARRIDAHGSAVVKMVNITYELVVNTPEPDRRLDLLHEKVRKYGTIYNTVASATNLSGTIRRGGAGD